MGNAPSENGNRFVIERRHLDLLLGVLDKRGYRVVGPTVRDGAIIYDEVTSTADLPTGWKDEQDGGTYRLVKRDDEALFGYAVGPHSWKRFLHPPVVRLWQATRKETGFEIVPETNEGPKLALIGVRSCELHAIQIRERVFMRGSYVDYAYKTRRENTFIVALTAGRRLARAFACLWVRGRRFRVGFDLALTEVLEGGRHYFVVQAGTELGKQVFDEIPHREADAAEKEAAERVVARTADQMGRTLDTTDIKGLLYRNYEHPRWDDVNARCLHHQVRIT